MARHVARAGAWSAALSTALSFNVRFPAHFCDFSSVSTPSLRPSSHICIFPRSTSFSSSRRSLWSALLSHVAHRGKARGQGRRFASKAQRVRYITATRHFNGDPGVCFIGTAPGSSLTLPFGSPNRAAQLACLLRLFSWLQMLNTRISAIPQSAMKRNTCKKCIKM